MTAREVRAWEKEKMKRSALLLKACKQLTQLYKKAVMRAVRRIEKQKKKRGKEAL